MAERGGAALEPESAAKPSLWSRVRGWFGRTDEEAVVFDPVRQFLEDVFPQELAYLRNRWKSVYGRRQEQQAARGEAVDEGSLDLREEADDKAAGNPSATPTVRRNLVGLAFSGGGIRSATVNLGIAQALHRQGALDHVDYLSTVSGGGYLGSSLSTIMRDGAEFPYEHRDTETESPYLTWLRNHSNYLATRGPIDLIRLVAILVRGILINFLVLVPFLLLLALILDVHYGQRWAYTLTLPWLGDLDAFFNAGILADWAAGLDWRSAYKLTPPVAAALLLWFLVFPVLIRVFKVYKAPESAASGNESSVRSRNSYELTFAWLAVAIAVVAVLETLPVLLYGFHRLKDYDGFFNRGVAASIAGVGSVIGLSTVGQLVAKFKGLIRTLVLWGVGLLGLLLPLLVVLYVAEGLVYEDAWSRIPTAGGWVWLLPALLVALLLAGSVASFFSELTQNWPYRPSIRFCLIVILALAAAVLPLALAGSIGLPALLWLLGAAILGTLIAAVTGRFGFLQGRVRTALIVLGVIGGSLVYPLLSRAGVIDVPAAVDGAWLVLVLAVLLWLFSWLSVDVNLTAVLGAYRDRLSEAYLVGVDRSVEKFVEEVDGKERPRARADIGLDELELPDIDIEEDLDLEKMCVNENGGPKEAIVPYHLVNTSLNLQGSKAPDVRERNADFFMFSNKYCGGSRTGYCESGLLETVFPQMDLATAMGISAAAASPNMGKGTSWALVAIMTLFNIRLGYWVPHPWRLKMWERGELARTGAKTVTQTLGSRFRWRIPPRSFLKEMYGKLDETSDWVNLSDGGHLENLAVYELLRRRCRFIIAGDAEADPQLHFGSLADLKRYAWIDLGIKIDIDVDDVRLHEDYVSDSETGRDHPWERDPVETRSHQHAALGKITYPPLAPGGKTEEGLLLYLKSSFTGDEDETIREYRARSEDFPHESTADQFFSEGQFEAYRALGYHMAESVLDGKDLSRFKDFTNWFGQLAENLAPRMAAERLFLELKSELAKIQERLQRPEHSGYFYDLNKKLSPPAGFKPPSKQVQEKANLYLVGEQLRLMENVYLALNFKRPRNWENPGNEGWRFLFERWTASQHFKKPFPELIALHGSDFRSFCSKTLKLP